LYGTLSKSLYKKMILLNPNTTLYFGPRVCEEVLLKIVGWGNRRCGESGKEKESREGTGYTNKIISPREKDRKGYPK
jgi:hypothetical protein